jgi:PQ loop repeat
MKRALSKRVVKCLKDRTDAFVDYYPCMKDNVVRSQLYDSLIGIPAAFLTTFSFFPQIVKAYRTRRAVIIYLTSKTGQ